MPTDDDRFDDRYDDRRDDGPMDDEDVIRKAKSIVQAPAICLIVLGVLGFLAMPLQIYQSFTIPAAFEKAKDDFDKNPKMKDDEKKKAKEMMDVIKGPAQALMPVTIVICLAQSVVMLLTGFKLKNLTGTPGFLKFGSFVTILPCSAICCLLNIGFGIWALTTVGKPEVLAGLNAVKRRSGF